MVVEVDFGQHALDGARTARRGRRRSTTGSPARSGRRRSTAPGSRTSPGRCSPGDPAGSPRRETDPELTTCVPTSDRMSVVFPHPLGPSRPTSVPRRARSSHRPRHGYGHARPSDARRRPQVTPLRRPGGHVTILSQVTAPPWAGRQQCRRMPRRRGCGLRPPRLGTAWHVGSLQSRLWPGGRPPRAAAPVLVVGPGVRGRVGALRPRLLRPRRRVTPSPDPERSDSKATRSPHPGPEVSPGVAMGSPARSSRPAHANRRALRRGYA